MDLYLATLDGFPLDIETLDDSFEKAIARYDIPYQDGALLEDLGQKAHVVKLRCWFWDDGADHLTYDSHLDFINHLSNTAFSMLEHPEYGRMQGCIETVSVRHNDRQRCAEVDISFVEVLRMDVGWSAEEEVATAAESEFVAAQEEQQQQLTEDLAAEDIPVVDVLDPELSLSEQFADLAAGARAIVKDLDGYLAVLDGAVNSVLLPVNSLISTLNYAANLPGRILGTITHAVARVATLYTSLINFPARFAASLRGGLAGLEAACNAFAPTNPASHRIVITHVKIACAQQMALAVAGTYAADESRRNSLRLAEKQVGFSLDGRLKSTGSGEAVATVNELETSLALVMGQMQEAITASRPGDALKTMTRQLLEHVNVVKLERERIVTTTLDNALPLHLVCLKQGLTYRHAERIMSLNPQISNPNRVQGTVAVYVR